MSNFSETLSDADTDRRAEGRAEAIANALRRRDTEWVAAFKSWRKCSSRRLSWESGGHCSCCAPLQDLLRTAQAGEDGPSK